MDCSNCKEHKELDEFYKGHKQCKVCVRQKAKLYRQKKVDDEIASGEKPLITCEKCGETTTDYLVYIKYCNNCERKRGREYRRRTTKAKEWTENNRERMSELQHRSYVKNKPKIQEKYKNRLKTDEKFNEKVQHCDNIRALIKSKTQKSKLECSRDELIEWFEYQFKEDMKIENHGSVWCVDHVIPCKEFLDGKIDKSVVFNYLNLKPVDIKYNLKKNKHYDNDECKEHFSIVLEYLKENCIEDNGYLEALEEYMKRSTSTENKLRDILLREVPKASTTTSDEKSDEGTRLIVVPNGNNVDDVEVEEFFLNG